MDKRYEMDFRRIPFLIQKAGREILENGNLSALSRNWPGGVTQKVVSHGGKTLIYITLPPTESGAKMVCTHMAIAVQDEEARVFHVERSDRGTVAIGEMRFRADGRMLAHINYGEAYGEDNANIRKIWRIAFEEERFDVERYEREDDAVC